MPPLDTTIAANRDAVSAFLSAARAVPAHAWNAPRGPGKWSPAQVALHVVLAYELTSRILRGTWTGPSAPRLLRPLLRIAFLNPVLRHGRFKPGGRAPAPFQPPVTAESVGVLGARLEAAARALEDDFAAHTRAGRATFDHPFFGRLAVADFLQLQVIHTNHHRPQLGVSSAV